MVSSFYLMLIKKSDLPEDQKVTIVNRYYKRKKFVSGIENRRILIFKRG